MSEVTYPSRSYFEVDHGAFDELIQRHLAIPGFEAQRVFEWPNDSYEVATADAGEDDEEADLMALLRFLADTREAAIAAEKQEWVDMMAGHTRGEVSDPQPYVVLDRQLASYQRAGHFPPHLDAFLSELARRDIIPAGRYLISICW